MIKRLQRIASFLKKIRFLIIGLGVMSLLLLLASFFDNPWIESEIWTIPSLLLFCWSLALFSLEELFINVPEKLEKTVSWRLRVSNTIRRAGFRILGMALILLSAALLILSYQLIRTWYIGYA
tara:strand:+ start:211 stop:579 length:369 start_codon:yes stop_codon:yes gene_type:complete